MRTQDNDLIISYDNEQILDSLVHVDGNLIVTSTMRKDLGILKSIAGDLILIDSKISILRNTILVKGRVVPSPALKAAWSSGSDSWRKLPKL
jgi:hypothetical protein